MPEFPRVQLEPAHRAESWKELWEGGPQKELSLVVGPSGHLATCLPVTPEERERRKVP